MKSGHWLALLSLLVFSIPATAQEAIGPDAGADVLLWLSSPQAIADPEMAPAAEMPAELSGGQRQRVGFARALAAGPSLMLLDEPFGALDPITREDLRTEFRQIQKELDLTAVLVTHDMTEALLTGDRIIVMRGGRIVGQGQPAKILRDPGDPYVARLMESPTRHAERLAAMTGNDRTRP